MPKFIIDLGPIGFNEKIITKAPTARSAVHNALYNLFEGDKDRLKLFVYNQKSIWGEDGWSKKVEEMADEIIYEGPPPVPATEQPDIEVPPLVTEKPEESDQLQLFEFIKTTEKGHPAGEAAREWKALQVMEFVEFDELKERMEGEGGDAIISVKYDGELVGVYYNAGRAETVTQKGTVRTGMPVTHECAQLMSAKGYKTAILMAELYAIDQDGKPKSYMTASNILKKPEGGQDQRIRLAVFDIHSIDGKQYENEKLEDKLALITQIFSEGKYVHPIPYKRGGIAEAEEQWKTVPENHYEGLVVHMGGKIFKVKPIMSYDMAIVAVEKSSKVPDRIGALLAAFIDKDGYWRLSGAIGGGMNDHERAEFFKWAERNKVSEDEERIWVNPMAEPMIVEVTAYEVNLKEKPALKFADGKWTQVEQRMSGVLRFPQLVRLRDDKEPKYPDVRPEQLGIKSGTYDEIMSQTHVGSCVEDIYGNVGRVEGMLDVESKYDDETNSLVDRELIVRWDRPIDLGEKVVLSTISPSMILRIWS